VVRYIFEDLLGLNIRLISDREDFATICDVPKITLCSSVPAQSAWLFVDEWISKPSSEIIPKSELEDKWDNADTPFPFNGEGMPLLNFDIFSATFFLLSRYEEYRMVERDKYGRVRAQELYMHKRGLLEKPIVNIWAAELREALQKVFPSIKITTPEFSIIPTIDIDHAFLVKHKSFLRRWGGIFKYPSTALQRLRTLVLGKEDVYFNLTKTASLHRSLNLKTKFFFLCGNYNNGIDNGDSYKFEEYQKLFSEWKDDKDIEVGVHFSVASQTASNLAALEKTNLENAAKTKIVSNRNHFLMLSIPRTYEALENFGITNDYTMGCADVVGFRAGCCTPFKFYNLRQERIMPITVFPLTCMDTTFFTYLKTNKNNAFAAMYSLREEVRNVGGVFIPLFHNETLADNKKMWQYYKNLIS
jgi:hypothetical protein